LAKVVWTHEAERWLLKIHDYIAQDKPAAAFKVVESIYARAQVLEQFPSLGQSHRTQSGRDTRILLWGHYRIVYLQANENEVHIVGVFHGAMELDHYLK
jgi:plasmid stabilization system protein ParE